MLSKSEMLHELKHENHVLNTLIVKMKAMKTWRQNHESVNYLKKVRHEVVRAWRDSYDEDESLPFVS